MKTRAAQVELYEHKREGKLLQEVWCAKLPDGTLFAVSSKLSKEKAQEAYEAVLRKMVQ